MGPLRTWMSWFEPSVFSTKVWLGIYRASFVELYPNVKGFGRELWNCKSRRLVDSEEAPGRGRTGQDRMLERRTGVYFRVS